MAACGEGYFFFFASTNFFFCFYKKRTLDLSSSALDNKTSRFPGICGHVTMFQPMRWCIRGKWETSSQGLYATSPCLSRPDCQWWSGLWLPSWTMKRRTSLRERWGGLAPRWNFHEPGLQTPKSDVTKKQMSSFFQLW